MKHLILVAVLLLPMSGHEPDVPRRVLVIGHRGNPAEAPENTLSSIRSAFAVGADLVEVDVRLSRDGIPVIIHDPTVDRTPDGQGPVAAKMLAELKHLDAGSWKDVRFSGERVPTLAEALAPGLAGSDLFNATASRHDMGRGDSRNSPKMTRKKAQRKLKARLARKRTAGKAAPAKKAVAKEVAPKKRREKPEKPAAS